MYLHASISSLFLNSLVRSQQIEHTQAKEDISTLITEPKSLALHSYIDTFTSLSVHVSQSISLFFCSIKHFFLILNNNNINYKNILIKIKNMILVITYKNVNQNV